MDNTQSPQEPEKQPPSKSITENIFGLMKQSPVPIVPAPCASKTDEATSSNILQAVSELQNMQHQVRAKIISQTIKKALFGSLIGGAASLVLFKRRLFPIWTGLGFGLGLAWSEGSDLLAQMQNSIVLKNIIDAQDEKPPAAPKSP